MSNITPERLSKLAVWMGKYNVEIHNPNKASFFPSQEWVRFQVDTCQNLPVWSPYQPDKDPAQAFELLEYALSKVEGSIDITKINEEYLVVFLECPILASGTSEVLAESITLAAMELAGV